MSEMPDQSSDPDLVEDLARAAADAVRNQRPDLTRDPLSLRSVTVELEVGKLPQSGAFGVQAAESWVQRRISVNSILGLKGGHHGR